MIRGKATASFVALLTVAATFLLAACRQGEESDRKSAKPPLVVEPASAAELTVNVLLEGDAPPPKTINMRAAPLCARQHSGPVFDPSLIVHDGRVANAVVWIAKGLEAWSFPAPDKPVVIDQKGCMYEPHVVVAGVGQPVEFRNSDPEPHNVHSRPSQERGWNFMISRTGTSRTVSFRKAEVAVPIGCDVHPWMSAYVAVVEHPYAGVTDSSGSVKLPLLPPGTYTVRVWHELLGTTEQTVSLQPRERKAVEVRLALTGASRGPKS